MAIKTHHLVLAMSGLNDLGFATFGDDIAAMAIPRCPGSWCLDEWLGWFRRIGRVQVEACPTDNTKRSRFGQIGCSGSNRRNRCHRQYATGAIPMGVPGWPELACWTASMHNVRIVLMAS